MVTVALNEADAAFLQRHLDAAAARAHIAGGIFDFLLAVIFDGEACVHFIKHKISTPRERFAGGYPCSTVNPASKTVSQ
jgi:hypothetical protein